MSIISFNAPNNAGILSAINGHLSAISEDTKKMGYTLDEIKAELSRVASSAEIIAGTLTKEEVIAEKEIKRLHKETDWAFEFGGYYKLPNDSKEEIDEKRRQIKQLKQLMKAIREKRAKDVLKLCGERE